MKMAKALHSDYFENEAQHKSQLCGQFIFAK